MKQIRLRVGAGALLLILVAVTAPARVFAADPPTDGFNITLSPTSQNLDVKPGASVTTVLQVRNNGLSTEHLKATVMKFGATGPNGTPQLLTPSPNDDFVHWVSMPQAHFTAEPGVWNSFPVTINPPKTAAFGYYYALVFTRDSPTPKSAKGQALVGSLVSLILLNVQAPGAVREASISEFSTQNKFVEFLPTFFTVRMHNNGNVHVAPRGNIFISKGNKMLATLEVNLSEGNILPNSYRRYTALWNDGSPVYTSKADPTNKTTGEKTYLDWNNFGLGKLRYGEYHARLVMVYNNGENDVADQAALNFWVMPWRIIAGLVVVLLLVLAGAWALIIRPLRRRMKGGNSGRGGYAPRR